MKIFRRLILLLSAMPLLGGCIYDDISKCPWIVLTFSYTGDTDDATMFGKMIDGVTLHCYDASTGWLVLTQTIDKEALNKFQGTNLNLDPGEYKIITWANVGSDSEISGNTTLPGARVNHPHFPKNEKISTNDHLYYGEYDLTVPENKIADGDVPHKGAHINMEVYIKGTGSKADPTTWPVIEMTNLMPQYTMQMKSAQPFATTYHPNLTWENYGTGTEEGLVSRYQVLRFSDDNDIEVLLKSQKGELISSVNLKTFMEKNSISVDGLNEATVKILFELTNLGVSISLPDWTVAQTDPEF